MMFEFDIEDVLASLDGLTIQDKVEKVYDYYDELEDALADLGILLEDITKEYVKSITAPLLTSVKSYIKQRKREDYFSIQENNDPIFTVELGLGHIKFYADWNIAAGWYIQIEPTVDNNPLRYKVLSNLAIALNLPYKQGRDEIRIPVKENELQSTMLHIISNLIK